MKLRWQHLSAATLAGAMLCSAFVLVGANRADAKRDLYELVPPPPPTPVLQVPPPPVMVPYSYASDPYAAAQFAVLPAQPPSPPVTNPKPQPPQPAPHPRPTGLRPANAPNLNLAYARAKGFGAPRAMYNSYSGPGAAEAFPVPNTAQVNTWFDSSLRWYANHVNAQRFYNEMFSRAEYGIPTSGYAAASGMFEGALPHYEYNPPSSGTKKSSGHHHHHRGHAHGHRVIAMR